jgi:RND superfamily putative drug exporter
MFITWGKGIAAHRWLVLVVAMVSLAVAIGTMATVSPDLSSDGFLSEDAESGRVDRIMEEEFGLDGDVLVFLFDVGQPVSNPEVRTAVESSLAVLDGDPRFVQVATTWSTGNPDFVSNDGQSTYAVAVVASGASLEDADVEDIRHEVESTAAENGLPVMTGGGVTVGLAIAEEIEEGIIRAEMISIPLTIIILVGVFGSLVAAGVPLLIGAVAIVAAMGLMFALSTGTFQSIFAINIITMLGLGLGIDYSLFMVSRFREEITHRPVDEALAATMATVGKAILFSGITVLFGLAGTLFFPLPALRSMGIAGMVVTAMALVYGLTLLPALLAILGTRVNALSIRRHKGGEAGAEGGFWHGLAGFVMRYPVAVIVSVLAVLLVAGLPVLRLDLTPGGADVLPENQAPREVVERLQAEFPAGDAEPIPVLVSVENGDPASAASVGALRAVVADIRTIPGVTQVNSFVTSTASFDWASWDGDPTSLPEPVQGAIASTVRDNLVLIEVSTGVSGSDLEDVVRDIRALPAPGMQIEVGGDEAARVDTIDGITAGVVPAAIFVVVGSYLILLLTFGSVFLPIKAIFMTLLSISASLGAVVWIFQDGNLQGLFGFEATGEIISTTPILMFCILFGLSMDYEVLMLSRIQEEYQRTGDNRVAVATGLEQTAKVITGAALIMVVVFGGFMFADIVIIKSMGFGLALAVLIDATIVRGLLVPATMRVMGRWNWWAPAPIRRVVERLGLGHGAVPVTMPGD